MADQKPEIVCYDYGKHNEDIEKTIKRLNKSAYWKRQNVIVLIPAANMISAKVALSHWNLIFPPNQQVFRMLCLGMEVGAAYSEAVEYILNHPDLSKFQYVLTLEHDNVPPPDGVLKLLEHMEANKEFSVISMTYFCRGEGGCCQIWGDIRDTNINFRPVSPKTLTEIESTGSALIECYGVGMGAALWRLDMFKDKRLPRPLFKTQASKEGVGTQDLYFFNNARKYGYRCAVACDTLCGHMDLATGIVW